MEHEFEGKPQGLIPVHSQVMGICPQLPIAGTAAFQKTHVIPAKYKVS